MRCVVPVNNPDGPTLYAEVDEQDFLRVLGHKWQALWTPAGNVYAQTTITEGGHRYQLLMHQLVLVKTVAAGCMVDHINTDTLDNRRANLRVANKSQNQANTGKHRQNTSGYKGVTLHKRSGRWQAQISKDGRMKFLGLYADPREAAQAYDRAARQLYGEFARPNFPHPDGSSST